MVEKGRAPTIPTVSQLLAAVDADRRVTLVPLDRTILDLSMSLTSIAEMHDRQIVATALHLAASGSAVALLTRDVNITVSRYCPRPVRSRASSPTMTDAAVASADAGSA